MVSFLVNFVLNFGAPTSKLMIFSHKFSQVFGAPPPQIDDFQVQILPFFAIKGPNDDIKL